MLTRTSMDIRYLAALLVAAACLAAAPSAHAQVGGDYDLSWNSISGGGGRSTGGFILTGTIGQSAPGTLSGGSYTLTGGFLAAPPNKPGDIDGDGQVNIFDIFYIAEGWNTVEGEPNFAPWCDLDGDGQVSIFDIFVIAEYWNT